METVGTVSLLCKYQPWGTREGEMGFESTSAKVPYTNGVWSTALLVRGEWEGGFLFLVGFTESGQDRSELFWIWKEGNEGHGVDLI